MIVCQTKVTLLSYVMYFFIRLSYFICCYIRNCTNIVFIFHSFIEHIRLTLHFQMKGWFTILFKCICMTIANIVILYTGWYMILHHANHHSSCECHSSFEWLIRVTLVIQVTHHSSDSSFKWRSSYEWSFVMWVITHHASDHSSCEWSSDTRHSSDSSFEWLVIRMTIVMQVITRHANDD